ncbi:GNAT family N-acetyltransferase [Pseudobacillus badius]|uniref:GNAT family N-acetyltransferase n=1 Tax=Bacillus badius TaxID=1455 RepID=UPI003D338C27
MEYRIRKMIKEDWKQVQFIYEAGIATGNATFETQVAPYEKWVANAHPDCCLVAEDRDKVLGWCKVSSVSDRCVYTGVGEVSVYVHPDAKGKRIGSFLLGELIKNSEEQGFWTLQSSIFPENIPSLQLHKKHGFRELGRRERIAKRNGVWRDTLILERRSKIIGVD